MPDTDGEFVQYESWMAPGGNVGVPHVHPLQESRFAVISGTASFLVDGQRVDVGPGGHFAIPPKTPHYLWNAGEVEIHLVIEFRPGLLKQEYYETIYGLARDGKHRGWWRNMLQLAVLTAAYRNESRPLNQSWMTRFGLLLLMPVGLLLGYRAHYPGYCIRSDAVLGSTRLTG